MGTILFAFILAVFSTAAAKSRIQFTRYSSWNSQMYPVWQDGDPRHRDSWTGGEVTFDISNDAPTLTGAKTTFNIQIRFPPNQMVLPEGQVVWAEDCIINNTSYYQGQAVYPDHDLLDEWDGVFPDGTPFNTIAGRKPHYVYVWKTWGHYWQVADGPSSSLTIGTDDVPLGSYNMEVVIYHIRSKEKFIPLGFACTQFSITDQIPFAVSLSQVNDVNEADQTFILNRGITFVISLHDPSGYLSHSDITFNWDFGDNSGTLISRDRTVTHTYISTGSFQPKLVLQAVIPKAGCSTPVNAATSTPVTSMPPGPAQGGSTAAASAAGESRAGLPPSATTSPPVDPGSVTAPPAEVKDAAVVAREAPDAPVDPVILTTSATAVITDMSSKAANGPITGPEEEDTGTLEGQAAVVVVKREAPAAPANSDCVIYRYGSFSADLDIVQGIERVEIVQMANIATVKQNTVDLTVTCQGSLPTQVCTVVSGADCGVPMQTTCNAVTPSADCLLILQQVFNDAGIFCINVSLTNNVSLAVSSARVRVTMGSSSTVGTVAMVLVFVILAVAIGAVAFTYRHFKDYQPLKEDPTIGSAFQEVPHSCGTSSVTMLIWNLLTGQTARKSQPVPPGRVV
ncbi:melanocyte protein PMEL-like [Megalops cyprinoides]|uniref:melanocyte protein PMEL-like n=1 Tax=Megalops cyprinoides TaxID=118141 RepID=UPI0018643B77|nr:melanocyte protein PMEL-like [Megalops cyprinoides]